MSELSDKEFIEHWKDRTTDKYVFSEALSRLEASVKERENYKKLYFDEHDKIEVLTERFNKAYVALENKMNTPWLSELCKILGWQGGTIWQVMDEVKNLKIGYDKGVAHGIERMSKETSAWVDKAIDAEIRILKLESELNKIKKEREERDLTPEEACNLVLEKFGSKGWVQYDNTFGTYYRVGVYNSATNTETIRGRGLTFRAAFASADKETKE